MAWLPGNLLVAVGGGGRVLVAQDSGLRYSAVAEPLPGSVPGGGVPLGRLLAGEAALAPGETLLAVTARGRGFVAAGSSGTVYFFSPPGVEQKRCGGARRMG
jgi:hypothetical protein